MSVFVRMASGVQLQEEDLTGRARLFNSSTGGIVFESDRGSVQDTPVLTTQGVDWIREYGPANPKISRAHDCALAFHEESSVLYNKRVVNGALHAGLTLYRDRYSKLGLTGVRLKTAIFPIGLVGGYQTGARDFDLLAFTDDLIAANSFTMQVSDGTTSVAVGPTVYATSHNATLNAIAAAITTALASFGSGGIAQVISEPTGNNYLIAIWAPTNATVVFTTPAITLGTTQTTAQVDGQARIIDVFADNPGIWGNDIGIRITNVNPGIQQRFRLVIGGPLITGNSFGVKINGTAITPVAWATDSDTTLAAIATALAANANVLSATVETVPGAVSNDRAITIIAKNAGPDKLLFTTPLITGGASQVAVTIIETLRGILSTGEMSLDVYDRANVRLPVERILVSMAEQKNGRGQLTTFDRAVNTSSTRSRLVKVVLPEYAKAITLPATLVNGNFIVMDETIRWLGGGDAGAAVTNNQIATGWDPFYNRTKVASRLLINGGYASPVVQQKMIDVAEKRYDAIAILDVPQDKQLTQAAFDYRMYEMNVDSSYGALYTPDLLIPDDDSNDTRWAPPSGHVAAAYAYSERTTTIYHAPAGLVRGKLKQVLDLQVHYTDGDREILEPNGINPIIDFPAVGPAIFGEETLQYRKSVLSSVHARRLLNLIEVAYADEVRYNNFDPNNEQTQFQVRQVGEKLLRPFSNGNGLYDYEVVCDSRNNTAEIIDEDGLQVWVYLQIVRSAKRILIKAVLTPTGAKFAEYIALETGTA